MSDRQQSPVHHKRYLDLAIVLVIASLAIGGLITTILYNGHVFGDFDNHDRQEVDMDINTFTQTQMYSAVSSVHKFNDLDKIDKDGIDFFDSVADGERCHVLKDGRSETAKYTHEVHVNALSNTVTVNVDGPDDIYCLMGSPPFVNHLHIEGVVITVDGNPVVRDGAFAHMVNTKSEDCDGHVDKFFDGFDIDPQETKGKVSVNMLYKEGHFCEGMSKAQLVAVLPQNGFN